MPLIKNGEVVADPWQVLADEDALPAAGPVIVSLERWTREHNALGGRGAPVGVRLASHQPAAAIADDLPRLALVALEFPTFRDGRPYSTARLLRERHGFDGELRAVGNVLRDQFLFMVRCGFDALEVADEAQAAAWRKAMSEFSVFYQAAADRRPSAARLRQTARAAE